jgi:hypothetical protein
MQSTIISFRRLAGSDTDRGKYGIFLALFLMTSIALTVGCHVNLCGIGGGGGGVGSVIIKFETSCSKIQHSTCRDRTYTVLHSTYKRH